MMPCMRLEERKEQILNFIVRHYVDTALPVSSGIINQKSKIDMSAATIRNAMLELDEEGYLTQPHTSAGRIPTEKGYRYFIKHCTQTRVPAPSAQRDINRALAQLDTNVETAFDELSRALARQLGLFSGVGILSNNRRIFSYGIAEVLREPEFVEHDLAMQFAEIIDHLEETLDQFSVHESTPRIDIGIFGIVSASFRNMDKGECVLFSIGPQRMNYEAARSLTQYTIDDLIGQNHNT